MQFRHIHHFIVLVMLFFLKCGSINDVRHIIVIVMKRQLLHRLTFQSLDSIQQIPFFHTYTWSLELRWNWFRSTTRIAIAVLTLWGASSHVQSETAAANYIHQQQWCKKVILIHFLFYLEHFWNLVCDFLQLLMKMFQWNVCFRELWTTLQQFIHIR